MPKQWKQMFRLMDTVVIQKPSSIQMVKSCRIIKWYGVQIPFEYQTKFSQLFRPPFEYPTSIQVVFWILDHHLNTRHLNTRLVKVRYSDDSDIQLFSIQIPTVIYYSNNSNPEYLIPGHIESTGLTVWVLWVFFVVVG